MKNTIIICGTILVIFSVHSYLQFSKTSKRAKCANLVSQKQEQREVARKDFFNEFTKGKTSSIKERSSSQKRLDYESATRIERTMGISIDGMPKIFSQQEANGIYRLCLTQHGIKPEDLFK